MRNELWMAGVAGALSIAGLSADPGDQVKGTFAPMKTVFALGEPVGVRFTMRNPPDAPPVGRFDEHVAFRGDWRIAVSRDGTSLPTVVPTENGGAVATVFSPGDSSSTLIRLRDYCPSVGASGHYVVNITHGVTFRPVVSGTINQRDQNTGVRQIFTGTIEFDIGTNRAPAPELVRGHVTGVPNLVGGVPTVWLNGVYTSVSATVRPDGSFEFPQVQPDTYQIGTPNALAPFRTIVVGVGHPSDADVPIAAKAVAGRVITTGTPPLHLTLAIRVSQVAERGAMEITVDPRPDGTFSTPLPLGRWVVGIAEGLPAGQRITALTYGATNLLRNPLAVASADAGDFEITLGPMVPAPMAFVSIAPGEFMMGCSSGDTLCAAPERPAHSVRITKAFAIGKIEVTQSQWESVMSTFPSEFAGGDRPVEQVSWNDVQEFLRRLNALNDGFHYRLPTEAEWEYAARATTTGPFPGSLDSIAWTVTNSGGETRPTGLKAPNRWGLYDIAGNVSEMVQDFYAPFEFRMLDADPLGPATGQQRVFRGGSWQAASRSVRVSTRLPLDPNRRSEAIGFRIVRDSIH